jgi:gliding motility-associated-like protein
LELFPNSSVYLYDRWGQKVFESQGYYEPWDGQGVFGTVPAASYYYVIILDETDKGGQVVKGSVAVVR